MHRMHAAVVTMGAAGSQSQRRGPPHASRNRYKIRSLRLVPIGAGRSGLVHIRVGDVAVLHVPLRRLASGLVTSPADEVTVLRHVFRLERERRLRRPVSGFCRDG